MARIDNPRAGQILDKILRIAEQRYGPRIPVYRVRGVKFGADIDKPQISFSGSDNKDLYVLINSQYHIEQDRVCYQMAHECIHLLAPVTRDIVTVLEEGLATQFGADFMRRNYVLITGFPPSRTIWEDSGEPRFEQTRMLYAELLNIDNGAIRTLREIQPVISLFTPDLILRCYPQLSHSTAKELCSRFESWRNWLNPV